MEQKEIFRKKSLQKISSPEELNNYLRVTSPSMWMVLVTIILFLAGVLVWSTVGTLETTADAYIEAKDSEIVVVVSGSKAEKITKGMTIRVNNNETVLDDVYIDEYSRAVGSAILNIADGKYNGEVVIESVKPISFLIK